MTAVTWLADVLRAAGVEVVEYPGWKTRTAKGTFTPKAVMVHHDASTLGPSPYVARMIAELGNGITPPPLSQCWVDMAGVWHVLAAGRANHAGVGAGWGVIREDLGNEDSIGVETDHTVGEDWPEVQVTSLRVGEAAILRHLDADPADALAGHREYAPGRKRDPDGLDMAEERRIVAALMRGDDVLTTRQDGILEGLDKAAGYTWAKQGRLLGEVVVDTNTRVIAMATAVTAIANDPDITPDELGRQVNAAVAEHMPTADEIAVAQRPYIDAMVAQFGAIVREKLGEDNAELADEIVDELTARLAGASA